MNLESILEPMAEITGYWQSLVYDGLVLLVTLAVTLVIHLFLRRRWKRPTAGAHIWRDAVLGALNAPLQALVWVIGVSIISQMMVVDDAIPVLANWFGPVREVVIIAIVVWFVLRLQRRAMANLRWRARGQDRHFDETAADAISKLVTATIILVALLVTMQTFGFSVASLLTFGGVAGIALGFAAQGLVSNLLGGVTIYASRPFKVGDHIIFQNSNPNGGYIGWQSGEVQHIGWRATRILDWNGKPFYVPNSKFNTETVINHSRMYYREVSEYVYVRFEDIDKVAAIVADVNRMLEQHPDMGDYLVFKFDGYGEYALKLYMYAYTTGAITSYPEYMRVKQELLIEIAAIIVRHDARLAVPVSTVYLPKTDA